MFHAVRPADSAEGRGPAAAPFHPNVLRRQQAQAKQLPRRAACQSCAKPRPARTRYTASLTARQASAWAGGHPERRPVAGSGSRDAAAGAGEWRHDAAARPGCSTPRAGDQAGPRRARRAPAVFAPDGVAGRAGGSGSRLMEAARAEQIARPRRSTPSRSGQPTGTGRLAHCLQHLNNSIAVNADCDVLRRYRSQLHSRGALRPRAERRGQGGRAQPAQLSQLPAGRRCSTRAVARGGCRLLPCGRPGARRGRVRGAAPPCAASAVPARCGRAGRRASGGVCPRSACIFDPRKNFDARHARQGEPPRARVRLTPPARAAAWSCGTTCTTAATRSSSVLQQSATTPGRLPSPTTYPPRLEPWSFHPPALIEQRGGPCGGSFRRLFDWVTVHEGRGGCTARS